MNVGVRMPPSASVTERAAANALAAAPPTAPPTARTSGASRSAIGASNARATPVFGTPCGASAR